MSQPNERWKYLSSITANLLNSGISTEAAELCLTLLNKFDPGVLASPGEATSLVQALARMPPYELATLTESIDTKPLVKKILADLPYLSDPGRYQRQRDVVDYLERRVAGQEQRIRASEDAAQYYRSAVAAAPAPAAAPPVAAVTHGRAVGQGDYRPGFARVEDNRLRYEKTEQQIRYRRVPQKYRMGGLAAENNRIVFERVVVT